VNMVKDGCSNLTRHIENTRSFGIPVVIAINAFPTDTPAEHEAIRQAALAAGASAVEICTHHAEGGLGATELRRRRVGCHRVGQSCHESVRGKRERERV